jgi:hypothetical protein
MKSNINIFYILIISFLFLSCGNDDFKKQSELGSLRVLSISADTPEINSASLVTLTPLISYVEGGTTTLNYSWVACPDPGIDFGADLNCDSAQSSLKVSGSGTFSTAGLSTTHFTGLAATIAVNIPAAAFSVYLASLDSTLQFNGVDYICIIKYVDSSNANEITALKRIKLSTKALGDLNVNPSFTGIEYNNVSLTSYPSAEGKVDITGTSAAQTYSKITNVGTKQFNEDMFISWYSSTGEYLFNRTDIGEGNTFTPSGTTGVFVAVYRDGRGGVFSVLKSF